MRIWKSGSIKKKKSKMIEKKYIVLKLSIYYLAVILKISKKLFFFFDNLFKKLHSSRVSKKSSGGPVMVESSYELHPACSMRTRKFMLTSKSCWWGGIEYVRVMRVNGVGEKFFILFLFFIFYFIFIFYYEWKRLSFLYLTNLYLLDFVLSQPKLELNHDFSTI